MALLVALCAVSACGAQGGGRSVSARIAGHLHADLPGPERARRILEELLPLDGERRVEVDVWLACLLRSRVDESLAEPHRNAWAAERHFCRLAIASCHGLPVPGLGQELAGAGLKRQAARLPVFIDGLTLQTATSPARFTPDGIRAAVAEELRLVTGWPPLPAFMSFFGGR